MNDSIKNCPSTKNEKCIFDAYDQFVWDNYKAKYYFKENYKM